LTASSLNSGVYSRFGMFFIFFPFKNNVNFTSPLEDYFSGEAHTDEELFRKIHDAKFLLSNKTLKNRSSK